MLRHGCSLNILPRTCENIHGVLDCVDWVCPVLCTCLFILIPGVLKILYPIYLPIFVLRVGLLTLM